MESWKTLSRTTILDHSQYLVVENHAVQLPDGRIIPNWPWIITPDYINALVVTRTGDYLCFRQTKYGVQGSSLAVVGGYLKPGEDPLIAAQRETLEETGYTASHWVPLGSYCVDGNRGAGTAHLFLATGAERASDPHPDDLEEQVLLRMSRAELEAALSRGEFKVLAWATTVALALLAVPRSS